jgi:azurin
METKMKLQTILLIYVLISACGDRQGDNSKNSETSPQTTDSGYIIQNADSMGDDLYVITASGNTMSEISYDITELRVPEETEITIRLHNTSSDPYMLHNLVIIEKGKASDVGQAGGKFKDVGYVNPNDLYVIAHSPLSNPGETVEFTFVTPERGEYEFICTYPGHWGMMKGKFIVE